MDEQEDYGHIVEIALRYSGPHAPVQLLIRYTGDESWTLDALAEVEIDQTVAGV